MAIPTDLKATKRTTLPKRPRARTIGSVLLAGSLLLAACGDDAEDPVAAAPTAVVEADNGVMEGDNGVMEGDNGVMEGDNGVMEGDDGAMADAMLGAFGPACGAVPTDGEGSFAGMADDPAGTAASNNPLLSTLVTAVSEAGLVDTLNSEGPFTIFAPVNDAFAAIPEDTLASVLADQDLLTQILTYHVIAGESIDADGLGSAGSATAVEGTTLDFGADGTSVNGVDVICSNVPVANGTVHIVDQVLLPQEVQDALAAAAAGAISEDEMSEGEMSEDAMMGATGPACGAVPTDGEGSFAGMADDPAGTAASNNPLLSTLVTAVSEAGLVDTLNSEGPFTIFAPVNDAFAAIPEADLAAVLADTDLLTSILTLHVVAGEQMSSADLISAGTVTTVNGGDLTFGDVDGSLTINDGAATSICMDVPTANATVHIIDAVLFPQG